ncbi:unnamed protein product [Rotaria sordida]|uniref:Uncharacterized protein n=1 Tax=Rotaria sordida TaxID=392033 RepID=A0A818JTK4_9BILA|nr:unnamed protein product [Rotaria sordida]
MSIIHILGAENRFISSTDVVDLSSYANKSDLNSISSSSTSSFEQLLKFVKLGSNPNSQMVDGNTFLHLSASNGQIKEHFNRLQHKSDIVNLYSIEENNNQQILILETNCEQLKDENNQLTNDLW